MTRGEHEIVLRDERDDLLHLRHQVLSTRDGHKWPILLGESNLVLGVERRHPDQPSPSAGHLRHVLDRGRVDAADREVQVDSAEDFDARDQLAHHVDQTGGRLVVILEDDRAHAPRLRKLRDFNPVDRPRTIVGKAMDVDVDRSSERASGIVGAATLIGRSLSGGHLQCTQHCDCHNQQRSARRLGIAVMCAHVSPLRFIARSWWTLSRFRKSA